MRCSMCMIGYWQANNINIMSLNFLNLPGYMRIRHVPRGYMKHVLHFLSTHAPREHVISDNKTVFLTPPLP